MKLVLFVVLYLCGPTALANWGRVSDITLGATVAGSIAGMPDWEKRGLAAGAHAVNYGLNHALKLLIRQERPDLSDNLGMPSGHAQSALMGAGLVCREHGGGWCAGGVGLGLTTMIGRYKARRHSIEQVSVGGALGFGLGFYGVTLTGSW